MPKPKDLMGQRFGRLQVTRREESRTGRSVWQCQCDCGGTCTATTTDLTSGKTTSCKCIKSETAARNFTRHGKRNSKVYRTWSNIKQRCTNPRHVHYHRYGGRGITMDPRWIASFEAFLADVGEPPTNDHTIDRKENDTGYTKDNCHWVLNTAQQNNKSTNVTLTANGRTLTVTLWARELGVPPQTLFARKQRGWTDHQVINGK